MPRYLIEKSSLITLLCICFGACALAEPEPLDCTPTGNLYDRVRVSGPDQYVNADAMDTEGEVLGVWWYLEETSGRRADRQRFELVLPDSIPPYDFEWDTTKYPNGNYNLIALAKDLDLNAACDIKPIQIRNRGRE